MPSSYVTPCPTVHVEWRTVEDLVTENRQLRGALAKCDAKITAARNWNAILLQKNAANVN